MRRVLLEVISRPRPAAFPIPRHPRRPVGEVYKSRLDTPGAQMTARGFYFCGQLYPFFRSDVLRLHYLQNEAPTV
jgi:hypothetical protein